MTLPRLPSRSSVRSSADPIYCPLKSGHPGAAKFLAKLPAKMLLFALIAPALLFTPTTVRAQYNLPAGTSSADEPSSTKPDPTAAERAAAEDALAKQDYTAAQQLLSTLTTQHPGDARALYDLGFAEDALDHTAAAETAYRRAIAVDPKQFESHLGLALLLARQSSDDAARKELETALTLTPLADAASQRAQAYRALAALDRTHNPPAALDALLNALKLSPETPDDTLLAAELAESNGDPAAAEAAYRKLLAASPGAIGPTTALAHLLVKENKLTEAETLLNTALTHSPNDPALNAQLAAVYGAQGKPEHALPMLEKLHADDPQDANITRMLADLYTQTGRPADADPLYATLLKQGGNDPELLAARGDNLIRQQRYAEAETVLKSAVALKPDLPDAWSGLAFAASQNHEPSTTLQALSMRAKYLPEVPSTLFLRATAYDTLHQYRQAEEYYKQFIAAASGKFPDQEFEARHRLVALAKMH